MRERRIGPSSTVPDFNFNLQWVPETSLTFIGDALYLGRWRVAALGLVELNGRGFSRNQWKPICFLPGLNPEYEVFDDPDTAKTLLESLVTFWLSRITEE